MMILDCNDGEDHPCHRWSQNRGLSYVFCEGRSALNTFLDAAVRPTWDETWMNVARTVARRSLCGRDEVGAVVVDRSNRIIDTGYNGPPAGFTRDVHHASDTSCVNWCPRARGDGAYDLNAKYHDCPSLHAEQNALMFSDRRLREGGTIYVTSSVCGTCAKLIANSGLERVVIACADQELHAHRRSGEWVKFMETCGLTVVIL